MKTPGKFSSCVTGSRKVHKSKKFSAEIDTALPSDAAPEITTTSLAVNTSQELQEDFSKCETTLTALENEESLNETDNNTINERYTFFFIVEYRWFHNRHLTIISVG